MRKGFLTLGRLLRDALAPKPRPRRPNSVRPQLEALEGRLTPTSYSFVGYLQGSSAWGDPNNWQPRGVPVNNEGVSFDTTSLSITIPATVTSLTNVTINSNYSGTLKASAQLTVTGAFVMNGAGATFLPYKDPNGGPDGLVLVGNGNSWTAGSIGSGSQASGDLQVEVDPIV